MLHRSPSLLKLSCAQLLNTTCCRQLYPLSTVEFSQARSLSASHTTLHLYRTCNYHHSCARVVCLIFDWSDKQMRHNNNNNNNPLLELFQRKPHVFLFVYFLVSTFIIWRQYNTNAQLALSEDLLRTELRKVEGLAKHAPLQLTHAPRYAKQCVRISQTHTHSHSTHAHPCPRTSHALHTLRTDHQHSFTLCNCHHPYLPLLLTFVPQLFSKRNISTACWCTFFVCDRINEKNSISWGRDASVVGCWCT